MTDTELQKCVFDKVVVFISKFQSGWFGSCIDIPKIKYTLNNRTSGCVSYIGDSAHLNFNMTFLRENKEQFLNQTVPHEVAHYCLWFVNGLQYSPSGRRIIHGRDWKRTMRFFGVDPNRCHSYNVTNTKRKTIKRVDYKCNCMHHSLTIIRHNKIVKGKSSYSCNKCHSKLVQVVK